MVSHTKSNIGQRLIAVSAALFVLVALAAGAMHTTTASAQSPSIYVNGTGGPSYTYGAMYGSNDTNTSIYGSMYGNGYVSSYPDSSGYSYPYSSTYYGSTFPLMNTTTFAVGLTPTYSLSGSYCTPSGGTDQIWVPSGAVAATMGC
jgi:hypothetical protein